MKTELMMDLRIPWHRIIFTGFRIKEFWIKSSYLQGLKSVFSSVCCNNTSPQIYVALKKKQHKVVTMHVRKPAVSISSSGIQSFWGPWEGIRVDYKTGIPWYMAPPTILKAQHLSLRTSHVSLIKDSSHSADWLPKEGESQHHKTLNSGLQSLIGWWDAAEAHHSCSHSEKSSYSAWLLWGKRPPSYWLWGPIPRRESMSVT